LVGKREASSKVHVEVVAEWAVRVEGWVDSEEEWEDREEEESADLAEKWADQAVVGSRDLAGANIGTTSPSSSARQIC